MSPTSDSRTLGSVGFIAPLTPREVSIVKLLPTHLTYSQIAGELMISINTLKSNLKSIYRKFGVTTRFEAVAVARGQGLIT